ncbi:hypothetical protein BFW01_g8727 [Lasiodiplodia theobromae]|nr:hypothetical protein BFW01_g8727 [Lasiodiplodia theobromae]
MPDSAWRSLHETHLANLRSHRALLDHLASLHGGAHANPELDAMRARAERIWEDAVRAGEIIMGVTSDAEMPTPASSKDRTRRISSGLEISAPGSPTAGREADEDGGVADGEEEDEEVVELEEDGAADVDMDNRVDSSKRIVVANIPPGAAASDVWQHLSGYNPIKFKNPIRPPKRSEIHVYALPAGPAHTNGFAKIALRSAAAAARAVRDLDGTCLRAHHINNQRNLSSNNDHGLIIRRYRATAPTTGTDDDVAGARTKNKKRLRRVSSGEHLAQQQQQRDSKRQRMDNAGDERSGAAAAAAVAAANNASANAPATPSFPFTFTAILTQAPPPPPPPPPAVEQEPEFEDISAEVEARLAEQAARRAAVRQKMGAAPTTGKRRRRSVEDASRQVGMEEEDEAAIAGIAGMVLVDRRPRKRMREGMAVEAEDGAAKQQQQQQQQMNGGPTSRARGRKDRRKAVRERGERVDESPRPAKRSRKSM